VLANFFALDETFRGGLRIATGDVNKDGVGDLLVTAGVGGGPRVAGYDGKLLLTSHGKLFNDFFAFSPELRNGFWVTAADADGDGFAEVIVGAGTGGAPRVGVYSGQLLTNGTGFSPVTTFFAGDETARSGVRVKAADLDNDGKAEVLAAPEAGVLPTVSIFNPLTGARRDAFYGFPTTDLGGVFVG
jgi:hypothetical protein